MNRIKTFNDGSYMPVWQEDLRFLQDASAEVIGALCKALLGRNYGVLFGCGIGVSGSITSIKEGYVYVDGEVVHVPAQSIAGSHDDPILEKTEKFDSAGDKIFKVAGNAETRQTYYTPYMKLVSGISGNFGATNIILNDENKKTLLQRMHDIFGAMPYEIVEESATGISGTYSIKYAKIGKQVFILSLSGSTGGTDPGSGEQQGNYTIYTLPEDFRPAVETFFAYKVNKLNDNSAVRIGSVGVNGNIQINRYVPIIAAAFNFLT